VDPPALVEQHTDPPAVDDVIRPAHRGVGQGSFIRKEKEPPRVLLEPSAPPVPSTVPSGQVKSAEDHVF
jgi:hypothetical protein